MAEHAGAGPVHGFETHRKHERSPADAHDVERLLLPSSSHSGMLSPHSGVLSREHTCLSLSTASAEDPTSPIGPPKETLFHRFQSGVSSIGDAFGGERHRRKLCMIGTIAAGAIAVVLTVTLAVVLTRNSSSTGEPTFSTPAEPNQPSAFPELPPGGDDDSQGTSGPRWGADLALVPSTKQHDYKFRPRRLESASGAVASDHGRCSAVGAQVLEAGGNAMDAAIATCICQGVLNPFASGAGGGFMLTVRGANGSTEFIDARETAPGAASANMFKDLPVTASILGGLAVGVPLELKGLELAWKRWGRLPWSSLFNPAISMARLGFRAHPYLVDALNKTFDLLQSNPTMAQVFLIAKPEGGWRVPNVGELCCVRPQLANTLASVAKEGAAWLYSPERAASLAAEISTAGGIMTAEDLMSSQPTFGPVTNLSLANYQVLLPPPPSSASTLATALNIMAGYATPSWSMPESWLPGGQPSEEQLLYQHYLVESMKHASALSMRLGDTTSGSAAAQQSYVFLNGDPIKGPAPINMQQLLKDITDPVFGDKLRELINDNKVLDIHQYGSQTYNPIVPELMLDDLPLGTSGDMAGTHISVVDANHMAVSLTSTLNTRFGSMLISASTGLLLNSAMDCFSRPDISNAFDVYPSEANLIGPGKRPLSPLSPVIITEDEQLRMVLGASGGPHILSATQQTIIRVLFLSWDPLDAVSLPRLHHQLLPNTVMYEDYTLPAHMDMSMKLSTQLRDYLASKGNVMSGIQGQLGSVQLVCVKPGATGVVAACDPRKDGVPAAPDF